MAKTKRSSRKQGNGMAGIPENQRTAVGLLMGIAAAEGKRITPKAAYDRLQKGNAERLEEQAAKDREQKAKAEANNRERATKAIEKGFQNLANVRDLLDELEAGRLEDSRIDHRDFIPLARSALVESVSSMEQALIDLEVLEVPFPDSGEIKIKGNGRFAEVIY